MAVNDQDNILHGPCRIYVDAAQDLGFTTGGVSVRKSNDYLDVEADQVMGIIKKGRTSEKMFVSTTILEAVLANMQVAFAEPGTNTSATGMSFGTAAADTIEHTITIIGEAPAGGTRTYTFHRAVLAEDVDHIAGARDAIGSLPITFECMKDPDNNYMFGNYVDTA